MSFVCILEINLHFPDNASLKGKRKELSSVKAQLQRRFGAAVAETDHHDLWQRSELTAGISVHDVVAQARYAGHGGFLGFGERQDDVVERALARVGLASLAERAFDTLSGGEQRRVLTARALASEARVLLLDEPTAGLDVAHVLRFFALLHELRRDGYALVCVLHDLSDVLRHADRALLLHQGRAVACGPSAEVLTPACIREVYGVHSHAGAALGFSLHGDYA